MKDSAGETVINESSCRRTVHRRIGHTRRRTVAESFNDINKYKKSTITAINLLLTKVSMMQLLRKS